VFALLCRDGMRGFGGVSKSEFYALSWREIFESYFAEFTEDGDLVPLRQRMRRLQGEASGDPAHADRELPSVEELEIPANVLVCGVPMDFALMWWGIWRRRGVFSTEQLLEKWCEEMRRSPPHNWRDPLRA
jgi:hypothetical protein